MNESELKADAIAVDLEEMAEQVRHKPGAIGLISIVLYERDDEGGSMDVRIQGDIRQLLSASQAFNQMLRTSAEGMRRREE